MRTNLLAFVLLFIFWTGLSARADWLLLTAGLVSAALVLFLSQRMGLIGSGSHTWFLYSRLPTYLLRLLWHIVRSNVDVAMRIAHPELPIKPRFIRLPIRDKNGISQAIHANSITLTPGTITAEVDERSIEVHVLNHSQKLERDLGELDRQTSRWSRP